MLRLSWLTLLHDESFAWPLKNGFPRLRPVHRPGSPLQEEAPDMSSSHTSPREVPRRTGEDQMAPQLLGVRCTW